MESTDARAFVTSRSEQAHQETVVACQLVEATKLPELEFHPAEPAAAGARENKQVAARTRQVEKEVVAETLAARRSRIAAEAAQYTRHTTG